MVRYDVFLSFREPETRDNLVQYLCDRLKRFGVNAFLPSEEIEYGEIISSKIREAIERSDICVPVFSQDFASSPACLMEVAQMVKSGKKILPIFFFVEPCDVRHQLGTYGKSFAEHERKKRYTDSTIKEWKGALKEIADMRGLEFKKADLKATLRAALEAALKAIGRGPAFKKAAMEDALDSALKAALQAALQAALGETDAIQGSEELKKATLEAALEAALGEIGVVKRPEFKKAGLGEMGGTKGQFYNDLFSGFRELEDFISRLGNFLIDKKEETKNLVGVGRCVPQLVRTLGFDYQDGRVIRKQGMNGRMVFLVRGMAGIGKTTLARELYSNIKHLFQRCSFLENVYHKTKHSDVESLQNKLIRDLWGVGFQEVKCSKEGTTKIQHLFRDDRVLIVLDNVESSEQIKPFANEVTWFGPGSIIILTSRRKDITTHFKVPENSKPEDLCMHEHEVSLMNEDDALELFYKYAIIKPENYNDLSGKITSAVGCLPFAIEIVGKYLCGKSKEIWEEAANRQKEDLEKQLEELYEENYDSLSEDTKEIFLDIACFFRGFNKRNPYYMWIAQRRRYLDTCFDKLQDLSFVTIGEENEFQMHNQLEIFGRKTVMQNCKDPRERSRLWDYEDVQTVLRERQGIKKVDALRVTPKEDQDSKFNYFHWKDFLHLRRLRFLDLDDFDVKGNSEDDSVDIRGNTEGGLWDLLWLNWHECREKSQLFALSMEKLVILDLCSSQVELTLEDWRTLMRKATRLKVLNAKDCCSIQAALEFPKPVPLEHLILERCILVIPTAHLSTSGLVHLVTLNMKGCTLFTSLPKALFPLEALKELLIDKTNIGTLDFQKGFLPSLEILSACKCINLVDVKTITILEKLQKLSLRSCEKLKQLPDLIGSLTKLQEMDLSHTLIGELPPSVSKLDNLQVLKMVRTKLIRFPEVIKNLNKLEELDFTHCGRMEGECIITGLDFLRILRLKGTRIFRVLARDNGNFRLHTLELDNGANGQMAS